MDGRAYSTRARGSRTLSRHDGGELREVGFLDRALDDAAHAALRIAERVGRQIGVALQPQRGEPRLAHRPLGQPVRRPDAARGLRLEEARELAFVVVYRNEREGRGRAGLLESA